MSEPTTAPSRYWYGSDGERPQPHRPGASSESLPADQLERGRRVLESLRAYQAAEKAMRRRTRDAMSMGENEMLVLRYLLRAKGRGRRVSPTDLARYLGISTASTTALLDRLERSAHVRRSRHPTDRRGVIVTTTDLADHDVRATLGAMHERMMDATRGLSEEEAMTIVEFLERMQVAVDAVAAPADTD